MSKDLPSFTRFANVKCDKIVSSLPTHFRRVRESIDYNCHHSKHKIKLKESHSDTSLSSLRLSKYCVV